MQGYILNVQKVRDEDTIVYILSQNQLIKSYRFYGARHPNITQGFKIDFELESDGKFLPRLRNTLHLGYSWLNERSRLIIWQQFMRLLYEHLKELQEVDLIYYDVLEECACKFQRQNPKRLLVQSYVKILSAEGRLHKDMICFICDETIDTTSALARGFLPAHEWCMHKSGFSQRELFELYESFSTLNLPDESVFRLYDILLEGL